MKLSSECAILELDSLLVTVPLNTTQIVEVASDVNLRIVLGDMYNKYNKFLIVLNSFGGYCTLPNGGGYNGGNNVVSTPYSVVMAGLPFTQNSYNGQLQTSAIFPAKVTLPVFGNSVTNSPVQRGVVFTKPGYEQTRLVCNFYATRSNTIATIVTTNAQYSYDFNLNFAIYGLYD